MSRMSGPFVDMENIFNPEMLMITGLTFIPQPAAPKNEIVSSEISLAKFKQEYFIYTLKT
jgi:hypothetical protein